ncbi:MAG: DUF5069 domain-containing protein [Verrucomicrobia bacterium]|nr:DUF5069 domain-containing protein [Verrucomicrobiota bacterium]
MIDSFTWATKFRDLFDRCVEKYKKGATSHDAWFDDADLELLAAIGCKPQELFDFIEDHCHADGGEPSWETALLIAAVRRDYFQVMQKGVASTSTIDPATLPAKSAEMEGIVWLPRIIAKAEAKLRGEMDSNTMFSCGGDRAFCSKHHLHPADFLRVVWAAQGDTAKILHFVKTGKLT